MKLALQGTCLEICSPQLPSVNFSAALLSILKVILNLFWVRNNFDILMKAYRPSPQKTVANIFRGFLGFH